MIISSVVRVSMSEYERVEKYAFEDDDLIPITRRIAQLNGSSASDPLLDIRLDPAVLPV